MFQQLHDCEDYYDHVYSVREPLYDVYDEDVVMGFHEVQTEMLRKVHDELQKMKVCIADSVKRLEKTVNHMVELVKDMRSSEEKASDGNVQQPSQRCVSVTQSANSTLKRGRPRTVPFRKCQTSHVGKPRNISPITYREGLVSTRTQKQGTLPQAPSMRWRFQVSAYALDGAMEKNSFGGEGGKGNHPFDRGKVRIMEKLFSKIVSRELEIRNEEKNMCIRSADAANKQHLEGVKKIAKLEAECQRLRSLVRKKLPGPAALAQMKLEVESLGGGDTRLKRSLSKASSPCKLACLPNQKPEDSPAVMEFRNRLSKVLESVSADADLGKILEDVKCILQDVNVCVDHDKPSDVQGIHQDLKTPVSRIHEFVLLLRTGEDTVTEGNDLVELINGFTITFDHVLSGVKKLDDFVSDLANVFNEAMELKVTFRGLTSSEVETLQESEQMLADIRSQLDSSQRSNWLADTQLRCMTQSYRSLETHAANLEIDVNQLKEKEREVTATAEKLAECQETIFVLGKQLKSLQPQPEQMRPPQRQSKSYSEDELGTKNYAGDEGDSADTWVNEVPRVMESPKCPPDSETSDLMTSPSRVGSRLSGSGSSGNPTQEKGSRGISWFFSSKQGY
ncbi:unnamed protein product [Brassica oleracea var. botrytis]